MKWLRVSYSANGKKNLGVVLIGFSDAILFANRSYAVHHKGSLRILYSIYEPLCLVTKRGHANLVPSAVNGPAWHTSE